MAKFENSKAFLAFERAAGKLPRTKSEALNGAFYGIVLTVILVMLLSGVGACSRCSVPVATPGAETSAVETSAAEVEVNVDGDDIPTGTQYADGLMKLHPTKATVERVVDGDTIVVTTSDGDMAKVRMIGIDTPESVHPDESKNTEAGDSASDYTKSLLSKGDTVWLTVDESDVDRYGRWLRFVWTADPEGENVDPARDMVNAKLVAEGWAVAKDFEPDVSRSKLFHALEDGTYKESDFNSDGTAK